MKTMKKLVSLIMALAMVMALAVSASAEDGYSITITPAEGTAENATHTYKIYKVFNAVTGAGGITYNVRDDVKEGESRVPAGFFEDSVGNVLQAKGADGNYIPLDPNAVAAYVTAHGFVAREVTTTGPNPQRFTGFDAGYYYITTSTGSLVTIDSAKPDAVVIDKNTVPTVTKTVENADKAIVEAGDTVHFTITITVGKGAVNYKLHDRMSAGLSLNNDLAVSAKKSEADYDMTDKWEKLTAEADDTFTVKFDDAIPEGTVITVTYSATVTSAILSNKNAAATNSAKVTYGEGNDPTPDTPNVEVYNAKVTITKRINSVDGAPLGGAGFVLKNNNETDTENYNKFYKLDGNTVTWVAENEAQKFVSLEDGSVPAITGLGVGKYILIESDVPAGYNQAEDKNIEIKANDYEATNLEQTPVVVNNTGVELPTTGGIGTTIFTVAGSVLMIGAAILYITKKRSEDCAN